MLVVKARGCNQTRLYLGTGVHWQGFGPGRTDHEHANMYIQTSEHTRLPTILVGEGMLFSATIIHG